MFDVSNGFDVVIGNPPYVSANELKKKYSTEEYARLKRQYFTAKGTVDLYIYFFECAVNVVAKNGLVAFITPNRYLSASYGEALRKFLFDNMKLVSIVDYSDFKVFEEVSTYPIVTFLAKCKEKSYPILIGKAKQSINDIYFRSTNSEKLSTIDGFIWGFLLNEKLPITEKVFSMSVNLTWACKINATSTTREAEDYSNLISDKEGYKLINTGTIDRYETTWGCESLTNKGKKFMNPHLPKDSKVISPNRHQLYSMPKIILAKIALTTEAFLDLKGEFASINTNCLHSISAEFDIRFILSWVNSRLFQYMFECFFEGLKMQGGYMLYSAPNLSVMCIKKLTLAEQKKFIDLVDTILAKKFEKMNTSKEEAQIDHLFYKLYELTNEEIILLEKR